jgi:hypothetical protein
MLINFLAISGNSKNFSFFLKKTKKIDPPGAGGVPQFFVVPQFLFFSWLKAPCKISEPYDNSFWEKSNPAERKKEETKRKFPLAPMGALALGSAHARPSAQAPIDTSGNFSAHMSGRGVKNLKSVLINFFSPFQAILSTFRVFRKKT